MLFTKDNYEKIEGLIEELNEDYHSLDPITELTYLKLNKESGRVLEVRKTFVGKVNDKLTDQTKWHACGIKDVTLCFKAMLMRIPE